MNTWNYRVVRTVVEESHTVERFEFYAIHEVYYDDAGKPESVTVEPVSTSCDSVDELREALSRMLASADKPILNYDDF